MQITIMVGPSGSGKSTYVGGLLRNVNLKKLFRFSNEIKRPEAAVLSADDITYDAAGFHPERLGVAHARCLKAFILTLERKIETMNIKHLIVDNTNTSVIELAPYIAVATALGAPINVAICQARWEDCIERSTHGVPWYVARRQCRQLEALLDEWPPFWPQPEFVRQYVSF